MTESVPHALHASTARTDPSAKAVQADSPARPRVFLVTLGDPNGLGPELVCRWLAGAPPGDDVLVIVGPQASLELHAARLGLGAPWARLPEGMPVRPGPGVHLLEPTGLGDFVPQPGALTPEGGRAAGLSLELASALLLAGRADALVTCPLNKAGLQLAGFDFPGHTEFLAERAGVGSEGVCMHLCGPRLRVSLVTTHPPLARVPGLVTTEKVERCLRLTADFARRLGLSGPVAVCGLNPHAGESGRIGDEEGSVIVPAMERARAAGVESAGPFPADTVFRRAYEGEFPAVLAMYHDQGLGPLKLVHFGEAVNVTLGLPYVRTSVDHGTGYDLVGRDTADLGSFREALELARRLA
ncbi:4-hydroxythreonine-4-phosphate dehydrogenase 2 [Fundidesulfovibrio magnetotacticus]|uniref:4-hydroxythreonine-4-phosphate dehydrogenase 2 n=1 Tax=Fundidesulfovibrio magnetotacticus TaxID=2730080 RepID=A0A6V8M2J2_9BACT|nr:4-hydroxythreonine-4-phosphate dehydrogenase PdxA [Fundidesulfovibrio magnetotacticus]GFK96037.1 4-hydroxythreonine-4-phosphate dehydrogenase 2 [Fundidesulfovibrio magnetotacticus]